MKWSLARAAALTALISATLAVPSTASADQEDGELAPLPAPATAAVAAAATEDTVHLRSGGLFRGRVVEIIPGDHVTILVAGGEKRRIAWPEVDRVVVASTTMPPPPPAAEPAPMAGPRARVHLKGSSKAVLFRHPAGTTDLVQVCAAPCDLELPLGDSYRIGGSGLPTTGEFRLQAEPGGSVEIDVSGPSWLGIAGGGVLAIGGGFTAYVGLLFAAAGGSTSSGCHSCAEVRNVGLGLLGAGAAMIGVGLAIVFPSMKTDLSQEGGAPQRDAFVRAPAWSTPGGSTKLEGRASPATFPALFEGHF